MEKVLTAAAIVQQVKSPALLKNWELWASIYTFGLGCPLWGVSQRLHISIICRPKTLLQLLLPRVRTEAEPTPPALTSKT